MRGLSLSSLVSSLFALMLNPSLQMLSHHLLKIFEKEFYERSVPVWILIVTKIKLEQNSMLLCLLLLPCARGGIELLVVERERLVDFELTVKFCALVESANPSCTRNC